MPNEAEIKKILRRMGKAQRRLAQKPDPENPLMTPSLVEARVEDAHLQIERLGRRLKVLGYKGASNA